MYVTLVPGTADADPSVLVTPRLARGSATTAEVAVLSAAVSSGMAAGPATFAVLESVPVNVDARVAVIVYVAEAPTARLAVVLSEPLPLAVQLDPADAVHVHVATLSPAGRASVTTTGAVP